MNFRKSCVAVILAALFSNAEAQGQTVADPNEGSQLTRATSTGYCTFSWWAQTGRTYFLQQSEDLVTWTYLQMIEPGTNQQKSWGFTSNGDQFFVRLKYKNIVADDPYTADFDGDGVSNYDELQHGTDPLDPTSTDTDGDGMPDAYEVANGLNKYVDDSLDDADGDGYPNVFEYKRGTKVNVSGLVADPANPVSKPPPIYTVDPSGAGTHTTIHDAIDQAASGYYDYQTGKYVKGSDYAIIIVKSGIYNETINTYDKRFLLLAQPGNTEPVTVTGGAYLYASCKVDGFVLTQLGNYGIGVSIELYSAGSVRLDNCIIRDNYSYYGGIKNIGSSLTLVNCTLLNNRADGGNGKAIFNAYGASTKVVKCILWDVDAGTQEEIASTNNAEISVQNSIVRGGGFGGTNIDPLLTPVGYLRTGSPAIDAGVAGLTLEHDIHAGMRPVGSSVDIGADEFKDTDGDGVPDWWEVAHGLDRNNPSDVNAINPRISGYNGNYTYLQQYITIKDSNSDDVPDWWDIQYFGRVIYAGYDYDYDGLNNLQEFQIGTIPNNPDTDGDEIFDGWEVANNLDPKSAADASLDPDNDGLSNLCEYRIKLDPHAADTGNTGVPDGQKDLDFDGLTNIQEFNTYHTDPRQYDTDGDGMNDGWEIHYGFNPTEDNTYASDPTKRPDADPDGDGLTNIQEEQLDTDPGNEDTDNDGFSDYAEANGGSNPNNPNSTPNNPGGPGTTPVPVVPVGVTFGDPSGSHSEKYRVILAPLEGDTQTHSRTNQHYGELQTETFKLPKGAKYKVTLVHVGTDPKYQGQPSPDYDYEVDLPNSGGSGDTAIFYEDPQGMLGYHDNVDPLQDNPFYASGKDATLYIAWLSSQTVATTPSNRTRTKLGVGELVDMTLKPTSLPSPTWSLTGTSGTSILTPLGNAARLEAGIRACTPTTQVTGTGYSLSINFNVVNPSDERAKKQYDFNYYGAGVQGAGMFIYPITTLPDDVSFSNVEVREVDKGTQNVQGFFNQFLSSSLKHDPNPDWVPLNPDNAWNDTAQFYHWGSPTTWAFGTYEWAIEVRWRVVGRETGQGEFLANRIQTHTLNDSTGKSTEAKLGQTAVRSP